MILNGNSKFLVATPVIQAAAYANGDQLGALTELPEASLNSSSTGAVLSLTVVDKGSQSSSIDMLLFSQKPVISSVDNAPLDISDAEMAAKFIGVVHILAADYSALAANSIATLNQVGQLFKAVKDMNNLDGKSIWMILQCRGTPTYTSTSDLVLKLGVVQD